MIRDNNNSHNHNPSSSLLQLSSSLLSSNNCNSNNWNTFVNDNKTQSYSYHLPHKPSDSDDGKNSKSSSWISKSQLDIWFNKLHPNNFNKNHQSNNNNNNNGDIAWTDASYKGTKLLRQTAWVVFDYPNCQCEYGYSDTWQPISTHPQFIEVVKEIANVIFTCESKIINCCNLNYYPEGGGIGFHADDEFLFDGLNQPTYILSLSLCGSNNSDDDGETCKSKDSDGGIEKIVTSGGSDIETTTNGSRLFQIQPKSGRTEDQIIASPGTEGAAGDGGCDVDDNDDDDNSKNNNNNNTDDNNNIKSILLQHGDIITMEGMFQKYYFHSIWPGDSLNHSNHPLTKGERINLTFRTINQHLNGDLQHCRGITCPLSTKTKRNTSK